MFSINNAFAFGPAAIDPESPIWLESSTVQMDFTLECNASEPPTVQVTDPDANIQLITLNEGTAPYLGRYTITQEGTYQANFECNENGTYTNEIIPFIVKKMTLDITSPENDNAPTIYPTGVLENIRLSLKINGVAVKVEEDPGFTATLVDTNNNRYTIDILEKKYDPNLKEWILEAQLTNKDIPAALYSIEITAKYTDSEGQDHTITDKSYNSVRVNQALIAVMHSPTPGTKLSLSTSKEQEIHIEVHEKGTSLPGLGATSFTVILTGDGITKELPVNALSYDENSNYYVLTVLIPEMDEKEVTYDLYAKVAYGNYKPAVTEKVQVDFVLSVSGRLADPTGNVYTSQNTMIKFTNNNTEKTLSINNLGDYSESLKAGEYDIKMRFPQVWQVIIDGVDIKSSSRNPIRYDYFTGNPGISGINIAKLVVIEFGLPFDKAYLQIPYNDALVKNENMLEVYACNLWNFGSRKCSTTWSKIPVKTDIVANFVEFNVTNLSAFVVGEKMGIFFEGALDATDVYSGEPVTLESRVLDAKGNGVIGAEVTYAISGTSLTGKTTTGASGEFTLLINTPNTAGKHSINIIAEKVPFSKYEKTFFITTENKKSISFLVPETADVFLDKEKKIELTIFNTGQVDLTNVKFNVVGLQTTWYSLIPTMIETIKVGEKKTIDLLVNIPEYDCIDEGCKKYYFVDIQLTSDQLHEEASFTAKIQTNITTAESITAAESDGLSETLSDITGYFTFSSTSANSTNTYIIITFIIMAFVIITIKKKNKFKATGKGSGRLGSVIGSVRREISRNR
ncbi:MAG: hypothetical protein KAI53_00515 [Candidatus Aenigmarchaeota archaeon]|nr:hypothetical protein [Candidatus Aenigmarchaeota archaeon]